ncbi:MAG: J domain-containing protein [Desulfobulbus sp.]
MLTREQALEHLNLPHEATREEIEQSYRRMVRRYPPEYHPERFRLVDESYRTLTSLLFLVENVFAVKNQGGEEGLARRVAELSLDVDDQAVGQGMEALRRMLLSDCLWPRGSDNR